MKKKILVGIVLVLVIVFFGQMFAIMSASNVNAQGQQSVRCCWWERYGDIWVRVCMDVPPEMCQFNRFTSA